MILLYIGCTRLPSLVLGMSTMSQQEAWPGPTWPGWAGTAQRSVCASLSAYTLSAMLGASLELHLL